MAQFKQGKKKGSLVSLSIPKLNTKQSKKSNELSVRVGAISRAIPQDEVTKKKDFIQPDMLHPIITPKSKKYNVQETSQFLLKQTHGKSKHTASSITTPHTKSSFHEQTASSIFKTKAEKKSMSLEKIDDKIGEDSEGNSYWYNGGKKIYKLVVGQQERECVSSGNKECSKLIKNLSLSHPSKNQDLISKLQESILPQIQLFSKNKKHKEISEWSSSDSKHHHDKKSQKVHSSSSTLFQSSLEAKQKPKHKKLTEPGLSKSFEEHSQVASSIKKDYSKSKDIKPYLYKQTIGDHKQSPDFSNSPHKPSKPNSIESTHSLADIKLIDPSNIPNDVTPTQRKKKRGRPPGPTDKTKKKLANKPLLVQANRGRPKKNALPILNKLKSSLGSPNITLEYSKRIHNPIRVTVDEFKKQKSSTDKKVIYEVQETSDSMLKEDSAKHGDELKRLELKRKDDKLKPIIVSKSSSNSQYISHNSKTKQSPTRKRAPMMLSSSSENDDSESSSSKPPPSKILHFRSSKSSESDTPDVPKTPGPTSLAPNPWVDMDVDLKNDTNKSSMAKINSSEYIKTTDTVTIGPAPSRGKYMPKKHSQQRPQLNNNNSPHKQTPKTNDSEPFESHDYPTKSPRTSAFSGKKIVSVAKSNVVGQKQLSRPKSNEPQKLSKQSSVVTTKPVVPAVESSEESSTDSTDSDSSTSSDESDDSPTKISDSTSLSQNISSQASSVTKPHSGGQDHPRVAYVFTTELANKAAAAVRRGEVRTIVEFHQKYQPPLAHLKLSNERRQNLENRNKSPQNGNVPSISGKKIADKTLQQPDTSSSESSSSSDEDSESSGQDSPAPSPAIHKPVPVESLPIEDPLDNNSDASSDQQDDLMSPQQMIPKTPGPPPGMNLNLSDDESEIDMPVQLPFRGKSQMNLTPGRDTDNSDVQDDMNIVPKTPGAGLALKHLELSDDDEDDDVMDGNGISDKDLSDDDNTIFDSFDKPPPAPRPPRTPDEDDDAHCRSDFYTRPTSPQFDNILKGLNTLPMSDSPSISPLLDLQLQARPPPIVLPNITPRLDRESPYQNPLSNHAGSSNNPSNKSTPTIIPVGSSSNESSHGNHFQNTEQNMNISTPLDNRTYGFPTLPQQPQFNIENKSHYSSPSRTPLHSSAMDPLQIQGSTPTQMPSTLHEAIAAPYRTPDNRRSSCIKPPLADIPSGDIGMLPGSARKDVIDSNAGVYQQQQQQQQQRYPMNIPYYYQNKQQTYQGTPPINMNCNLPQKHQQMMIRPQIEQNPYSQANNNDSSPLYIPEHNTLATDITSLPTRFPTDSIMHHTANGQYYPSNNTSGYSRMSTPRHESQNPQELVYSLQSTLPSHMNRPVAPTYVNGDSLHFNGLPPQQLAPPSNLLLENDNSLTRTFSEFSTPNLQGTPLDTNIANLNATLRMIPDIESTPQPQLSAALHRQDSFNFSEPTHSPIVATMSTTTSPPPIPSITKHTTSCSTSPPPQPQKIVPKPPKPIMVDRVMQTDGDDTWNNSKPELDTILEIETESNIVTTSSECQTETAPVKQVPKPTEDLNPPVVWDPSTGQKKKQEDEDCLMIRIPTQILSKDTKFLNGKISDDFVNISELPKLTPLNLKDREKYFQAKFGWENKCAVLYRKYYDDPPPLRSLFSPHKDMPQLRPIKKLRANGFGPSDQVELDFRDLPKLRPINPCLLVSNNS